MYPPTICRVGAFIFKVVISLRSKSAIIPYTRPSGQEYTQCLEGDFESLFHAHRHCGQLQVF